jgi:CRP/FNR family transcriptional regulator, cyclic AMP receptor protein
MKWAILRGLDDQQQREVLSAAVRRKFRNGETLFHQGDPGDSVHLLDRGHVAIKVVDRGGIVLTLDIIGPGATFGEQTLIEPGSRRTASTIAIGAVETLMIRRDAFVELQQQHPAVTNVLVEMLAAQVRRLSEQLLDAHSMGAEQRVVKRLGLLAAEFQIGDAATLPVTQEELAALAGTTRPTANRALQALVDAGTIELGRGRITIADVSKLNGR